MTEKKQLIGWERWRDPIDRTRLDFKNRISDFDSKYDDELDEDDKLSPEEHIPIIMTPVGLMPLREDMTPGKTFNFWIGHTTFRITQYIRDIIEGVDGVEVLDICTPYRMRVGIGKMFKAENVRTNIGEAIYTHLHSGFDKDIV